MDRVIAGLVVWTNDRSFRIFRATLQQRAKRKQLGYTVAHKLYPSFVRAIERIWGPSPAILSKQ